MLSYYPKRGGEGREGKGVREGRGGVKAGRGNTHK